MVAVRHSWLRLMLVGTISVAGGATAAAEPIFALDSSNQLVVFDSATPGTVNTIGAITGVLAGDSLVGIDFRPSLGPNNGTFYALGVNLSVGTGRIYQLDTSTAVATVGPGAGRRSCRHHCAIPVYDSVRHAIRHGLQPGP